MQRVSKLFSSDDKKRIEAAVVKAESNTSCEIVPVVATASGRYDRPEDTIGLWLAVVCLIVLWLVLPRHAGEPGSWAGATRYGELLIVVAGVVVAFIVGAVAGGRIGWLRRLFTPRKQMEEEVAARARELFFDRRIHHTTGATGLLIYVSLFERMAVVLGDRTIVEHPDLGQPFLDRLCRQLTDGLRQGDPTEALCQVIAQAGEQLAPALPREEGDINELQDTLVLID